MSTLKIALDDHQILVLLDRATLDRAVESDLGGAVREGTERIRAHAVRNVSGFPVSTAGGVFRVRVQTGALKGAIEAQWPYGDMLTGRVFVNGSHMSEPVTPDGRVRPVPVGRYAAAIEHGHGPIDLKKTMRGKIVPFFGARAQNAQGPYAERGLVTVGGGHFISSQPKARAAGRGPLVYSRRQTRSGGSYFISFRRVGSKGWIIPAAAPRPFMAAARTQSVPEIKVIVGSHLRKALTP